MEKLSHTNVIMTKSKNRSGEHHPKSPTQPIIKRLTDTFSVPTILPTNALQTTV